MPSPLGSALGLLRGLALLAVLCLPTWAAAQVSGTVTDAATGDPLIGAAVRVAGTSVGASTDLDGRYRIANVRPGQAVLVASYVGYAPDTVAVTVPAGGLVQDFALGLATVQGGEVVVSAQAEGQLAAINEQLRSNRIVNVVSAARIQELPDANAAEAVGRLPGVAIQRNAGEGEKVVVRGLSPKYTNVTVNGERIPSSSNDRSTNLTTVAPELLEGIELTKAITPDQDADAVGGTVNFVLRDAPDGLRVTARAGAGYNSQQGELGNPALSLNVSDRLFGDRLGVITGLTYEDVIRSSDVFDANYFVDIDRDPLPSTGLLPFEVNSVLLRDRLESRERVGGSLVLDYRVPNGKVRLTNLASRLHRDEVLRDIEYDIRGATGDIDYVLRDRDVELTVVSNALTGEHQVGTAEVAWRLSRSRSAEDTPYNNQLLFRNTSAFDREGLNARGPDDPYSATEIVQFARPDPDDTQLISGDNRVTDRAERSYVAQLDLDLPVQVGPAAVRLSAGGKYSARRRTNEERILNAYLTNTRNRDEIDALYGDFPQAEGNLALSGFLDPSYSAGTFLGGRYDFAFALDRDRVGEFFRRIDALDTEANPYLRVYQFSQFSQLSPFETDERVSAAYGMAEVALGPVTVLPGLRYEHTDATYHAPAGIVENDFQGTPPTIIDTTAVQSYGTLFPMLHVRAEPVEGLNVRAAVTRTIQRPSYDQLVPNFTYNVVASRLNASNPSLRPALSTNYDLIVSLFRGRVGLFTVGAFYKSIADVQYTRRGLLGDRYTEFFGLRESDRNAQITQPVNAEEDSYVRGVEVDWQTNLSYLPGLLRGVVFNANYAYIESQTTYPFFRLGEQTINPDPPPIFVREEIVGTYDAPLLRQPKHVVNVSLGYDLRGFSGRVSAIYQASSLTGVDENNRRERLDFVDDYLRFDASLKQEVGAGLGLFLNLNNLSDRADLDYRGAIANPTSQQFYGYTAELGVVYRRR